MFHTTQPLGRKLQNSFLDKCSAKTKRADKSAEFWRNYHIAGASNTSASKLVALAEHTDPIIRKRVAENLNIPSCIQRQLAKDENTDVRMALAANPSALVEICTQLAEDKSGPVRLMLARNHNMPVPTLINLTRDTQTLIAGRAQETLEEIFMTQRKAIPIAV